MAPASNYFFLRHQRPKGYEYFFRIKKTFLYFFCSLCSGYVEVDLLRNKISNNRIIQKYIKIKKQDLSILLNIVSYEKLG